MWFHRVLRGDSGALVDPFMHVGTYPTRHLATLSNTDLFGAGPYLHSIVVLDVWSLRRSLFDLFPLGLLEVNVCVLETARMLFSRVVLCPLCFCVDPSEVILRFL